jgi:cytochrome P450
MAGDTRPQTEVGGSDDEVLRNRTFGAGVVDDPYPVFHALRAACPVQVGSVPDQFPEMDGLRTLVPIGRASRSVYGYEAVVDVLRRPEDFASAPFYAGLNASIGQSVLGMDEPEHRRMRSLVQPAFARRVMEEWKRTIIRPIVDEHIDRIAPLGRADIYQEVGAKVPVHTIAAAIGLPTKDREQFFEWAVAMTLSTTTLEARRKASDALGEYIAPLIAARRRQPSDDLLSTLAQATVPDDVGEDVDRRPLSDEEINAFVRILVVAGAGTTFRGYGSLMYHLLTNPDVLEAVRADRSLVHNAIAEALRIEQPLGAIGRVTTRPCSLAGQEIPADGYVEVSISAANHDPDLFPEPERYDVHREHLERHIAFGFGIHRCVGAHLAEAELSVMLERTIDRLSSLRLDPELGGVHVTGLGIRMVTKLPVLFEPIDPGTTV